MAGLGIVRTVHPVPVALAGFDVGQETVPDERVHLGQGHPGLLEPSRFIDTEKAQLDALGDLAEQREVGAGTVVGRPERVGLAAPYLLGTALGFETWVKGDSSSG